NFISLLCCFPVGGNFISLLCCLRLVVTLFLFYVVYGWWKLYFSSMLFTVGGNFISLLCCLPSCIRPCVHPLFLYFSSLLFLVGGNFISLLCCLRLVVTLFLFYVVYGWWRLYFSSKIGREHV